MIITLLPQPRSTAPAAPVAAPATPAAAAARRARALLCAVGVSCLLAACGGGDGPAAAGEPGGAPAEATAGREQSLAARGGADAGTPAPEPGAMPWSDPRTWGGQVPGPGAAVVIPAGRTVVLDQDVALSSLTVHGTLRWAQRDVALAAGSIHVDGSQAVLRIGSAARPFARRATITLTGSPLAAQQPGMGSKFLVATGGGRLEIHGQPRVAWSKLNASALPGARQIVLADAVDWVPGDRVVIASTDLDPYKAEERSIAGVGADRRTLTLDAPLAHRHFGEMQSFDGRALDQRAPVGLLSRNVVIQGDADSAATQFGGHVMVMMGGAARISGVEFRRLGQFGRTGRYPFHWHLNGDAGGQYLAGSAFHSNLQRGIVVHGTHNTRVQSNVVYRSIGHSFVTEDGTERGNLFEGNLGILTRRFPSPASDPVLGAQKDTEAATFWIRGVHNRFVGNHAAGGDDVAYWFDDIGAVDVSAFEFRGNTAHSYLVDGRRTDEGCCTFDKAALWFTGDGYGVGYRGPFPIVEATLFKNRVAVWGNPRTIAQGFADVRLSRSILADNIMGLNSHGATDTVIVGRSANADTATTLGVQGVQEYGHSQRLERVTFVNFGEGTSAIQHRNCQREAGNVTASSVKLVNARVSLCLGDDHNSDMSIADLTGSIAGTGRPATLVPIHPRSRAMRSGDCPVDALRGMAVCEGLLGYANLHVRGAAATLTRDDGVVLDAADVATYPFYWTTIQGRGYRLDAGTGSQPQLEFTLFPKYEDDTLTRSVQIELAADSGFLVTGTSTNWFSPPQPAGAAPLPQATSLDDLAQRPGSAWYHDRAAGKLHLKVVADQAANRIYVSRR